MESSIEKGPVMAAAPSISPWVMVLEKRPCVAYRICLSFSF
jgi:hypothetical protein